MWTLRGTCAIQAAAAVSHVSDSNTNVDTDTRTRGCRDAAIAHPDAGDGLLQLEWDIPEGSGITSCQILWGPDADSLAVLLNASHRDAKGFVERGMEPEISYTYTVKSKNSPWAQQGALVPDGGQHHACAAAQAGPRGRADRRGCGGRRGGNGVVG